ncbi:MAG TPA: hypothetical protein VFC10_03365 [Terriglobia bacterium]|nr:hypothetical protein [Terriglobia bacterium]
MAASEANQALVKKMLLNMRLIAIILWLIVGTALGGAQDRGRVYSVCELLAAPQQFNGKSVKVRGAVEGGTEGAWLKSNDCPERFYVGENSLPKAISLSYQSEFGNTPARNTAHIERVEQQIKEAQRKMKSSVLTLTYTGIFETRTDWKTATLASGEKQLWGFGHLNAFPAQLVILDIADPVIVETK